jgi:hypothetical protein
MKVTTAATYPGVGIVLASQTSQIGAATSLSAIETNRYYYEGWSGNFNNQGSTSAYGSTWSGSSNKVIGVYLKGGALWFSIDGVVQNSGDPSTASTGAAITGLTGDFYPVVLYPAGSGAQAAWTAQFAKADWGTTPPSGYKAVNTANLPTPSITDGSAHFQPFTYASTGTSTAFVQVGNSQFEPGFVWVKSRTGANNHLWFDQVRGATKFIRSDTTDAENTVADTLTSFNSNGFTAGADSINWGINYPGRNNVAWQWKANGSGSSNTDGSITSTVSANPTAGFSIIEWSGTAANGTIGHGLGIQPSLYIVKNTATTNSWIVGSTLYDNTKYLVLNATDALSTDAAVWNSTYPTSSVINLGSNVGSNGSGTNNMICYAFAEIPGYSSIGSYTGNGSTDGPFVYTGFKPRWIMFKRTNAAESWPILDTARGSGNFGSDAGSGGDNPTAGNDLNAVLVASTFATEEDNPSGSRRASFNSNGFKVKTTNTAMNASGSTYIYMAFAEHPFGGAGVAPATGR